MNKNGYTMIELLAVITIIGLIFTIAIVSYTSLIDKANNTVYESYINNMHEAAINYFSDNLLLTEKKLMLSDLISSNRIAPINNPKNDSDKCLNSYIDATRNDENGVISIEYKVCLICESENFNKCKDFVN